MTMQFSSEQPHTTYWLEKANEELGLDIYVDSFNQRLIIKDLGTAKTKEILSFIKSGIPNISWLSKIIIFSREFRWKEFVSIGFRLEGFMNYFYEGNPACLLSKFLEPDRLHSKEFIMEDEILEKILIKPVRFSDRCLPSDYVIREGRPEDIPQLIEIYQKVFKVYPTPISDPQYLRSNLGTKSFFRVLLYGDKIISAASAEVDFKYKAAEMTDCATLPEYRGQGLMYNIIKDLEHEMREKGIVTLFSLARAKSPGSNRVFYSLGYKYGGRLINNCQIYSGYEDINIWEKKL